MKKVLFMFLAVSLAVLGASSSLPGDQAMAAIDDNAIIIDGSTTVGPIAKAFAEYYMGINPDVNITVSESGSGNGAKSLINGACDIADMSRPMKDDEVKAAEENGIHAVKHVVALDGIAIIVNPANSLQGLTVDQIHLIYAGKITNWSQVGGPNSKIVVISRDTNSGTYEMFDTYVMMKVKIAPSAEYVGSNGAIRQRVQITQGAIGYVGLGFVDPTVKAVTVNDITASTDTVLSGEYPLSRELYMYSNGEAQEGTHLYAFLDLCNQRAGKQIIDALGYIPLE